MCLTSLPGACSPAPASQCRGRALDWGSEACVLVWHPFSHKVMEWWTRASLRVLPSAEVVPRASGLLLPPPWPPHQAVSGLSPETSVGPRAASHPWGPGPGLSSFGGSLGGSGFGVRQTGLTSCEALGGKSTVLSRSRFPICKMGTVLLGAEDIVITCLAWCQVC